MRASEPWDLIVLDEAHHARRKGAGSAAEEGPNALLRLMRRLQERTKGFVLLTATPMQVHPVELWDLLDLLGLPPRGGRALPSVLRVDREARAIARGVGRAGSDVPRGRARLRRDDRRLARAARSRARSRARRILEALRDRSHSAAVARCRGSAVGDSSHARDHAGVTAGLTPHADLLRQYYKAGKISTPIADREVATTSSK